jgi:hypothetical protein
MAQHKVLVSEGKDFRNISGFKNGETIEQFRILHKDQVRGSHM